MAGDGWIILVHAIWGLHGDKTYARPINEVLKYVRRRFVIIYCPDGKLLGAVAREKGFRFV